MFEKYKCYTTENKAELICYEVTEEYAFLCPYTKVEDTLSLKISKTQVYSITHPEETDMSAIDTMVCNFEEEDE